MAKILLTGATGFLGSHLLKAFLRNEYEVVVLKRATSNTWRIEAELEKCVVYDIDNEGLNSIFMNNDIDIVVHTACNYGRGKILMSDVVAANVLFGTQLLTKSIAYGVGTFINTGTLLPKDVNIYSLTKHHFSEYLELYSSEIQVIDIQIEHMYGSNDDDNKFIMWLINKMRFSNEPISLTSGVQQRDFIYVDDVVNAYLHLINIRKGLSSYSKYDLGTGVFTPVKDFILKIKAQLEERFSVDIGDCLQFGAIEYRSNDIMIPDLDNSPLLESGWIPKVSVDQGISQIIKELK